MSGQAGLSGLVLPSETTYVFFGRRGSGKTTIRMQVGDQISDLAESANRSSSCLSTIRQALQFEAHYCSLICQSHPVTRKPTLRQGSRYEPFISFHHDTM